MPHHLSDQQLRGATLGGVEAETTARHLASCAECRARAGDLVGLDARVAALRAGLETELTADDEEGHLPYERLEGLVDGVVAAEEQRQAQEHLEQCALCRRELDEMSRFAAEWRAEAGGRRPAPRAMPRRSPRRWMAAAAAVAGLLVGTTLLLRPRVVAGPAAVAGARPSLPAAVPVADEQPVIVLRDSGGPIVRRRDGSLSGLPDGELGAAVTAVLGGAPLPVPAPRADLRADRDQLRGTPSGGDAVTLRGPLGVVVAEQRPLFTWAGGSGRGRVEVFDDQLRPVASGEGSAGRWQPQRALPRGHTYVWQLRAGTGDGASVVPAPPAPQARFHVLGAGAAAEVAAARASGLHLASAVVLARHGLSGEAATELDALQRLNPESDLPKRLRRDLDAAGPLHR